MTRLIVVYDEGSAGAREIYSGLCPLGEVVFALPPSPHNEAYEPLIREYAPTVPLAAVDDLRPDAVLTWSERRLRDTAAITRRLGLPGHDPLTAELLTDKYRQRHRLRITGVDHVRTALVTGPADWDAAVRRVGVPAVLKPATGEGSRDTYRIVDHRLIQSLDQSMVLEEYLAGRDTAPLGDYVSVETAVTAGQATHLAVTGKFPLLEPFRELGQYWPAGLPPAEEAAVRDLATAALAALDVRTGVTHTEIKLTPDGPRLIEVNGRPGGNLTELARRAHGHDLVRTAGLVALGELITTALPQPDRVYFQWMTPAPTFDCEFQAVAGVRELPAGVEYHRRVHRGVRLGGVGTRPLDLICGDAPNHAAMFDVLRRVQAALTFRFGTSDGVVTRTGTQLGAGM